MDVGFSSCSQVVGLFDVKMKIARRSIWTVLLIAFPFQVVAFGCRTTNRKSTFVLNSATGEIPKGLSSKMDWDRLSLDTRLEIMESEYLNFPKLKVTGQINPELLEKVDQKNFSVQMINYVTSNVDLKIEDEYRAPVGPLVRSIRFLMLNGETILGGEVRFSQQACIMASAGQKSFEDEGAALQAGCEIQNEHSWIVSGYFNYDGTPLAVSNAYEWANNRNL